MTASAGTSSKNAASLVAVWPGFNDWADAMAVEYWRVPSGLSAVTFAT